MNIVDQVCTLEQGKKLKELGVVQHSHFAWAYNSFGNGETYVDSLESIYTSDRSAFDSPEIICSAYTVAELGLMLPAYSHSWRRNTGMFFCVDHFKDGDDVKLTKHENEAIARASLLIELIESTSGQLALTNQVLYKQQNIQSHG